MAEDKSTYLPCLFFVRMLHMTASLLRWGSKEYQIMQQCRRNKGVGALARGPNIKAQEAEKLYYTGMKLVDIAEKLGVPAGTVRRWKSTYQWEERGGGRKANVRKQKKRTFGNKKEQEKEAVADEVKGVMENTNLTDKQRLFCIYYVRCFNATKAYQKAYGVNYQTARAHGYKYDRLDLRFLIT